MPEAWLHQTVSTGSAALLMAMQAFLPLLGATQPPVEKPGCIINMSSISGKYSAPFVGAYCASKHALEGMSDSLRRELMLFGIDVIVIGKEDEFAHDVWAEAKYVLTRSDSFRLVYLIAHWKHTYCSFPCMRAVLARLTMPCDIVKMPDRIAVKSHAVGWAGPGYVATPIWDREEITSTLAQYKDTAYAASLESFDKGIIEAVKKGHTPEQVARCVLHSIECSAAAMRCNDAWHDSCIRGQTWHIHHG